jgi:hypothetical protein
LAAVVDIQVKAIILAALLFVVIVGTELTIDWVAIAGVALGAGRDEIPLDRGVVLALTCHVRTAA